MHILDQEKFEHQYFQITDLWKRFCELHNELLDLTYDEYAKLLASDFDALQETVDIKELKIKEISVVENMRQTLIAEISGNIQTKDGIHSVAVLLQIMGKTSFEKKHRHLENFNQLLIDIIEKIQEQNKRNQVFINKALVSLKEIRLEASGTKDYRTYNKSGSTQHSGPGPLP